MKENNWWKEAVVYQIYPRSFYDSNGDGIGDLQGIIQKLDYLVSLGIDVVWLCPVYKSPNDDNGYDISDYEDIMEDFGTMKDLDQLLEEAHKRGIKIIMDLVLNHTSDEHPWFIESKSSLDNPKRDWYIWADGKNGAEPNNWESIFNGSAWEWDEETKQYYMHLFSTKQPDLNWENADVRNALYEMVNRWIDKGIDGFRIDAISHIKKKPGFPDMPNKENSRYVECFPYMSNYEGIDDLLKEFVDSTIKGKNLMTVGEANGVSLKDIHKWVGEENGYFNMIFQFEHLQLWNKHQNGFTDVQQLMKILSDWQYTLENNGWNALFLENHDLTRSVSTLGDDTIYREESAKMLGALYFFMKGTPFIYQGQEIGMTNAYYQNIEDYNDVGMLKFYEIEREKGIPHDHLIEILKRTCRDNGRSPMQWNDSSFGGFTKGEQTWIGVNPNYRDINVAEQETNEHSVLSFYKKMIELRKKEKVFIYGKYKYIQNDHPNIVAYTRTTEEAKALVLCNFGKETVQHTLPIQNGELILQNYKDIDGVNTLQPYEVRVYLLDPKNDM